MTGRNTYHYTIEDVAPLPPRDDSMLAVKCWMALSECEGLNIFGEMHWKCVQFWLKSIATGDGELFCVERLEAVVVAEGGLLAFEFCRVGVGDWWTVLAERDDGNDCRSRLGCCL